MSLIDGVVLKNTYRLRTPDESGCTTELVRPFLALLLEIETEFLPEVFGSLCLLLLRGILNKVSAQFFVLHLLVIASG